MPPEAPPRPPNEPVASGEIVPWDRVERFVGQVVHDLRNGLNACELQLTYLGEISADPEAAAEVKNLRATLAGLTRQLQNLRMVTGKVTAHTFDYPASDLFEDVRERFERLHPDRAQRVRWEISVDAQTLVRVDPELIMEACLELLNNASEFGDKDAPMICAVAKREGTVSAEIQNALAITPSTPPEDWGRAPLISTRRGAYGLGLFRVRRALEAQGARLDIQYSAVSQTVTGKITLSFASSEALPR